MKLADGKERSIQNMVQTSFWSADGKPMSAVQFLEALFGALPALFKSEGELRTIWSLPDTRKALLEALSEKGFGREPLTEMQKIISAEKSDIYDVLAYVAFASAVVTRETRAEQADVQVRPSLDERQREFVAFVLAHYIKEGVDQLDVEKLAPLLKLQYGSVEDAKAKLGSPTDIRKVFIEFQKFLYQRAS